MWGLVAFRDIALHQVLITGLTLWLTVSGPSVWGMLSFAGLVLCSEVDHTPTWWNWFEVSKAAASVLGLVMVNGLRDTESASTAHQLVAGGLTINMLQAVVSDIRSGPGHWCNALAGVGLLAAIPWHPATTEFLTPFPGLFHFSLSPWWVIGYTTWNAAFSYGFNYSWSTRMVLIAPMTVSYGILGQPSTWLGARCFSMCLNMTMRLSQLTYLYQPGESTLTAIVGKTNHNSLVRVVWGMINLGFVWRCRGW
jgi:hypothetical protein